MRKLIAAAAMVVAMAGTASAQGGGGGGMQQTPEQMAARMAQQVDVMFKGITITDAIKAKAVDILTKSGTDMRGIDRAAPDAADKRKAITDLSSDIFVETDEIERLWALLQGGEDRRAVPGQQSPALS